MEPLRITALASSNRRGSLNRRLLDAVVAELSSRDGVEVDHIDLRRLPLPLFDADVQERDGIPAAAQEVHDRVAASDAMVVLNPEYNGGYPALFKNLIDWVSRVDMFVFHPRYVGLGSATPGGGGGARGVAHTRSLFDNIFVTSHDDVLTVPKANEALGDDGPSDELAGRIRDWVDGFVDAARAHRDERAEAA